MQCMVIMVSFYNVRFWLCFMFGFSAKVKLTVPLRCVCMCILPGKAVLEMTYAVSAGTFNPTHSL